jgi:RHS repeat-associated protein
MLMHKNLLTLGFIILLALGFSNSAYSADTETDFNTHSGSPGPEPGQDNPQPDDTADDGGKPGCGSNSTNSPLYLANRQFVWRDIDVALPGRPDLMVARTYNAFDSREGIFGRGWTERCERSLVKTYRITTTQNPDSVLNGSSAERRSTFEYIYRAASGRRYTFMLNGDEFKTPDGINHLTLNALNNGSAEIEHLDGSKEIYNAQGMLVQELDKNGNALGYEYEEGALTRISDSNSRFLSLTYDASGHVATMTDHSGREWFYEYDERGALISVTDPLGNARQYEYESFSPEASGATYLLLTRITDRSGVVVVSVSYDAEGKVTSYTEGSDTYSYSVSRNIVYKRDSGGARWQYVLDDKGRKTQVYDPRGNLDQYEYDEQGNVTKYIDPDGYEFTHDYDELGRTVSSTTPDGTSVFEYSDANAMPVRIESPTGRVTAITYDQNNNPVTVTDPAGHVTRLEYNQSGDLVKTTNALGDVTTMTYNDTGQVGTVTNALNQTTQFDYDNRGNLVKVTNAEGEVSQYTYDRTTNYSYDPAGRLLSVTPPNGESVNYSYDEWGRLVTRTDFDGAQESYTYRSDNMIVTHTDRTGVVTQYSYDSGKRLSRVSKGSVFTVYNSYNRRSLPTSIRNETGTVAFSYDGMGRVTQERNNATVSYAYNEEGELISQSAFDRELSYEFDVRGLLEKLVTPAGAFDFGHDALGRRSSLTFPTGDKSTYGFDSIGQLTAQTHTGSFSANYQYSFDDANRLIQWVGDGATKSYQYSDASEVIDVSDNFGVYGFAYDEMGNRISDGGQFDENNRLLENQTHSFSYDANGNLVEKIEKTSGKRTKYSWNERNQLIKLERFPDGIATIADSTTTFSYGPLGRRWSRTKDGTTEYFAYSGMDRIATLDSRKQPTEHFDFGPGIDEPLVLEKASQSYFYFTDYLGSVKAISDGSAVVSSYEYSAYGQTNTTGDEAFNPYRYTGREYEELDLYYYRARYYDPDLGRFISSDPVGLQGGMNAYVYVNSNPVNLIDPAGLKSIANNPLFSDPRIKACILVLEQVFTIKPLCNGEPACECKHMGVSCPVQQEADVEEQEPEPRQKDCEALRQSVLATCASLKGKQKERCVYVANDAYRQCMGY